MAFLILDTDKAIENVKFNLKMMRVAVEKAPDKADLKLKKRDLEEELEFLEKYKALWDSRDEFDKIKHLKWKEPNTYIEKCMAIVKPIKGVNFEKNTGLFRVRITKNGERKDVGRVDTPQDAIDILKLYR